MTGARRSARSADTSTRGARPSSIVRQISLRPARGDANTSVRLPGSHAEP
jgi:hypothetical protein